MKKTLLFFCFCMLCACARKTEKILPKPEFKDIAVVCDTLVTPDSIALYSYKIQDSVIIVQTQDNEKFIKIVNRNPPSIINEVFDIGRAEGEFYTVNWIPFTDNNVGLYDIMKGFIYTYKLDKYGEFVQIGRAVLPKSDGVTKPYSEIIPVSETIFLMKSAEMKEVYIDIFDIEKQQVIGRIETDVVKDKSINGLYYDFNMAYADEILFISYKHIDRVEFYDFKDNAVKLSKVYGQDAFSQDVKNSELVYYYTYAFPYGNDFYTSRLGVPFERCTKTQIEIYPIGEGMARKIEMDGIVQFFDVHSGFIYLSKEALDKDILLEINTR